MAIFIGIGYTKGAMDSLVRDRKELYRKAQSWKRRGKSAGSFEAFIRMHWPTVITRIGEPAFKHLLAYVWDAP